MFTQLLTTVASGSELELLSGTSLPSYIAFTFFVGTMAMMAASAASSANAAASRTAYGGETYESKRFSQDAKNFANASAGLGNEASKKFTASVSRGNYLLILTVVGEGGQNKGSGLIKIDKRSGEEVGKLQLGDKEPTYDYDPVKETLFFKADKKKIVAYKL